MRFLSFCHTLGVFLLGGNLLQCHIKDSFTVVSIQYYYSLHYSWMFFLPFCDIPSHGSQCGYLPQSHLRLLDRCFHFITVFFLPDLDLDIGLVEVMGLLQFCTRLQTIIYISLLRFYRISIRLFSRRLSTLFGSFGIDRLQGYYLQLSVSLSLAYHFIPYMIIFCSVFFSWLCSDLH